MPLSPEQQAFVDHGTKGHVRLLAGPGTGKSFTSVAYLSALAAHDNPPRCHMVTFTRAATKELRGKVGDPESKLTERPPSTAHSFAMSVLMKADPQGSIRMADDWEKRNVIEEIIKLRMTANGHGVSVSDVRTLTAEMAAGWEALDGDLLELAGTDPTLAAAFRGAWTEAQRRLTFLHVSEIPYLACQLLEDRSVDVGIDVLVVDEYQDLNRAEIRFIELLSDQLLIAAIGDDDQSIYGWRNAAPAALLAFCEQYAAASFSLTECHRCAEDVLGPANAVIAAAGGRPAKQPLVSKRATDAVFGQLTFPTSKDEFDGTCSIIANRLESGVPANDIAILVRSSADTYRRELLDRLGELGVGLTNPDWVRNVLNEPEVRRLLSLGRLITSPDDSLAWMSYLKNTAGVGWGSLMKLYEVACSDDATFYDALTKEETSGFPSLSGSAKATVEAAVASARETIDELTVKHLGALLDDGGWGQWLLHQGDTDKLSDDAHRVFVEVGRLFMEDSEPSLSQFVNQFQPAAQDLADNEEGCVRLMTMAASKGLTVNTAILLAVDRQTIPSPRNDDYEEERRILYVAMTRATDFCVISFAQTRTGSTSFVGGGGAFSKRQRTPFLAGLPGVPAPIVGAGFVDKLNSLGA